MVLQDDGRWDADASRRRNSKESYRPMKLLSHLVLDPHLSQSASISMGKSHKPSPVLVIHGGAGTMQRSNSPPEQQEEYKSALRSALKAGYAVLDGGGEAMDAVVAAVSWMEDCELFNSGKGAVFNVAGKNELEASIMLSKPPSISPIAPSRRGIGTTLLTRTKNPSKLVRALYLHPALAPHTFLSGDTAETIGESELGIETVDPKYFWTKRRWEEHRRGLGEPPSYELDKDKEEPGWDWSLDMNPKGTVGAVALDANGCIACCTSTGGRTNKLVGRIGDTPIVGSGFWAEEWSLPKRWWKRQRSSRKKAIGISGTGDGDYFIRLNTSSTIASRLKLSSGSGSIIRRQGTPLDRACQIAVDELRRDGGDGGVIALNEKGEVAMKLNCPGMYRGVIRKDGRAMVAIFDDDILE